MDLEMIMQLAAKAGLADLQNPRVLVDEGDRLTFRRPPGLTIYGDQVVKFANLVEQHARTETDGSSSGEDLPG